ncbi:hypothetical protein Hanom_Chr04g00322861 [Helianthus anomalus]
MEIGFGKDDCYTRRKSYGGSCYKRGKKSELLYLMVKNKSSGEHSEKVTSCYCSCRLPSE